jgi:hypothetical protein
VRGSLSLPDRETAMMSRARALVLSVFVLGLVASALPAQPMRVRPVDPDRAKPSSHQRLGGGLEDMTNPETALAQRLNMARALRWKKALGDKPLDGDLARLAKKFLDDPKFLESLKGQFSREDIEQLKGKIREGKLTANDRSLRDLLERAKTNPAVTPRDRDALDKIAEKLPDLARPVGGNSEMPDGRPPVPPNSQDLPGATPWQQDPSRANDWLKGSIDGFVKNMDQWADTPSGKSWAESLKNLANRAESGRASTAGLAERTSALSRWLGKMNGQDSSIQPPRISNPSLPNLPRVGVPSGGSLAGSSSVLVVLLGMLLLALLLWRGRDWLSSVRRAGRSAWKLGPWPVRPEDVATRGDLVRAFEYLALLCLGPAARTCHHLELGKRIGSQPALDAERRRESATLLSHIYERARYTPDQEPLPGEELRQARRELAYLAGA